MATEGDGPVWSDFTEILALDAFADDIVGWAETGPPRRPTEAVMKAWSTCMADASRRLRLASPEAAAKADRHGNPAHSPYLPAGVAVDGAGRWWLLPGHPMPQGAQYRYRADDEWRTPVYPPDAPEMTVCWSALQAHEIRMGVVMFVPDVLTEVLVGWEADEPEPAPEWPVDLAEENPAWVGRRELTQAEIEDWDLADMAEMAARPAYEPHPDSPVCRLHGVCHPPEPAR